LQSNTIKGKEVEQFSRGKIGGDRKTLGTLRKSVPEGVKSLLSDWTNGAVVLPGLG